MREEKLIEIIREFQKEVQNVKNKNEEFELLKDSMNKLIWVLDRGE